MRTESGAFPSLHPGAAQKLCKMRSVGVAIAAAATIAAATKRIHIFMRITCPPWVASECAGQPMLGRRYDCKNGFTWGGQGAFTLRLWATDCKRNAL